MFSCRFPAQHITLPGIFKRALSEYENAKKKKQRKYVGRNVSMYTTNLKQPLFAEIFKKNLLKVTVGGLRSTNGLHIQNTLEFQTTTKSYV